MLSDRLMLRMKQPIIPKYFKILIIQSDMSEDIILRIIEHLGIIFIGIFNPVI